MRVLGAAAAGLSSEFCLALVVPRIRGREVEDLEVGRLGGSMSLGEQSSVMLCVTCQLRTGNESGSDFLCKEISSYFV